MIFYIRKVFFPNGRSAAAVMKSMDFTWGLVSLVNQTTFTREVLCVNKGQDLAERQSAE